MSETESAPRLPSHRRRFLAGLAIALLLAVGLGLVLLTAARTAERRERSARQAVVTLRALTELVERTEGEPAAAEEGGLGSELANLADLGAAAEETPAEEEGGMGLGGELAALEGGAEEETGDVGERVRLVVSRFAEDHPEVRSIRVVAFEGIRLEASSDPADTGERAAPRRLERDEKPLYDLGQKLRAAVAENRESRDAGGTAIGEEIAVEPLADGGFSLAGPVERGGPNGEVVGMIQMRTAPDPTTAPPAPAWLPALAAWLVPVVLLFLLALALGERRGVLAAVAAVLLVISLGAFARWASGVLETERRESVTALAAHMIEESETAAIIATDLSLPDTRPFDPARWDVDVYRQPHGLVGPGGAVDEGKLGESVRRDAGRMTRSVATVAAAALALLVFVGLGGAARVGRDLVHYRMAYAYTVPALVGMLLLVFFPFFYGIALSFTNANIYNSNQPVTELWVGIDNYVDILSDFSVFRRTADGLVFNYENFYWTLGFNIVWTIANVAIGVTLGLILALILNTKGLALRPIYRVLLILPWAVPNYITALIFQGMFHQQFGAVNQLRQIIGLDAIAWFDHPLTSFIAVLTTNGWLSFSFMMVVSLGALQSIPADLYEAAWVDGASRWQQFTAITLPSLKPALIPAIILSVIWTFNQFNVIFLVSAGQPAGATEILITRAYKLAFEQYRYGYAAAYAVVIFLILLAYGTFQNRATRATEAIGE
ncbi:MAG TPA: sugar ABC transporter permease [Thermoanaerobaculia bacterium]